jgi:hypothetical protein
MSPAPALPVKEMCDFWIFLLTSPGGGAPKMVYTET